MTTMIMLMMIVMMITITMLMPIAMMMMMMLSVKIPGGACDAHGPPRAGGRPHGANDDGRRHHGGSLWRLHGHRY